MIIKSTKLLQVRARRDKLLRTIKVAYVLTTEPFVWQDSWEFKSYFKVKFRAVVLPLTGSESPEGLLKHRMLGPTLTPLI